MKPFVLLEITGTKRIAGRVCEVTLYVYAFDGPSADQTRQDLAGAIGFFGQKSSIYIGIAAKHRSLNEHLDTA